MTITTIGTRSRLVRTLAAAGGATVLLLGAAACGSDGNATPKNATGQTGEQGGGGPQNQQGGPDGKVPGAVGKVAAVDGTTAQVQGMDGQVAVTWTAGTAFTKQVGAALSDVKVGDCVLVASADEGSGTNGPATAVTADTVRISAPANGSCAPTMRGPGGGPGPQLKGTPPSGGPEGGARPQIRGMGGAIGTVTAVSATGFTVASALPTASGSSSGTTTVTVTVDGGTTYSTMATGAATDVKVGVCVQADGSTDDTGAVTATSIAVTPAQDGQCGGLGRIRTADGNGSTSQES